MAPAHRRGPWVPEEDKLLLQLVREQGPNNWVRISQHMHYRSPKQCRERFHQNLKPSLNRDPISAEEGLMIERMVNEMGKRWAEIARRLGNRSDNAVKNWWNGSMNRKRRGLSSSTASPSRTYNGRVEAPYRRASMGLSSPARPLSSWTESPKSDSSSASVNCPRQLTPIFTLPALNRAVETPLISPAFSDISNASSLEPPAMIPDHNSVSSGSPRTISSPQLLPPLPVETRHQYGDFYRHSQGSEEVYITSTYHGLNTLESFSDLALKSRWTSDHQPWNQQSWATEPFKAEPSRDSRMGLNNLLN